MSSITILVADAATVFRAAIANVVAAEPDLVVLEAADAREVEAIARSQSVDLALVDLALPPAGALDAVTALRRGGQTEVVVWSFEPDQDTVLAALRAGARGYLNKDISPTALIRALRGTAHGEAPLSRELTALMIDALHGVEARHGAREKVSALSSREREVLTLIARGARNVDIAAALAISPFTVKRHVQNILQKLDVASRGEAAALHVLLAEQREWATA